jgi:hypothetical protein
MLIREQIFVCVLKVGSIVSPEECSVRYERERGFANNFRNF